MNFQLSTQISSKVHLARSALERSDWGQRQREDFHCSQCHHPQRPPHQADIQGGATPSAPKVGTRTSLHGAITGLERPVVAGARGALIHLSCSSPKPACLLSRFSGTYRPLCCGAKVALILLSSWAHWRQLSNQLPIYPIEMASGFICSSRDQRLLGEEGNTK